MTTVTPIISDTVMTSENPINPVEKVVKTKHNKNDDVWEHILKVLGIQISTIATEEVLITSKQMNCKEVKESWMGRNEQFEARLLAKMDNSESRPKCFKENGVYLLAVNNGTYRLIIENIYVALINYPVPPILVEKKSDCLLLGLGNSETSMLDNLRYTGCLDSIIGEPILYGPLLGGRHRCTFDTKLGNIDLSIKGVQFETDGAYETANHICIVEAKSIYCTDFNVRQLYLPYREVFNKYGEKKKIICLFIYKDANGIVFVQKYQWKNPLQMMDIEHIGFSKYVFSSS